MTPSLRSLSIALLLLPPMTPSTAVAQTREPDLAQAAWLIVEGTNAFRRERGVPELRAEPSLTEAARYFAGFMAKTDRFDHDADGKHPADRARQYGYDYCAIAENIGFEFHSRGFATRDLAHAFVEGWKHSPEHRKNMEEPNVVDTGVAVARSARTGRYYGVQMFGRSRSDAVEFQVRNASGARVRYRVGDESFTLASRELRRHTHCREETIILGGAFTARNGNKFVVVRDRNQFSLQRE